MQITMENPFKLACNPMDIAAVKVARSRPAKEIVPEDYTQPFLDFMNNNPTVFHAVDALSKRLESNGFVKLHERNTWIGNLRLGGKYYVTRNGSSLVAFSIPPGYRPGNGVGMNMVAAAMLS